jgi:hypothetical protein
MSRMRIALAAAVVIAAASVMALPALAAPPLDDSATQTVKFTNRASVRLTLSTPNVNFGNVDPLIAYTQAGGTANVRANANWTLTTSAPASFTEDNGGTHTVPIGRLALGVNGGAYTALAAGGNAVSSGTRTTNAGVDTTLGYQLTLDWADDPNTAANNYQAILTYTATTP